MDKKEFLRKQVADLSKQIKELERKENRNESADKVNALLNFYAKGHGEFGKGLIHLSQLLNVGRGTLVSWACKEALPREKQRARINSLYQKCIG